MDQYTRLVFTAVVAIAVYVLMVTVGQFIWQVAVWAAVISALATYEYLPARYLPGVTQSTEDREANTGP